MSGFGQLARRLPDEIRQPLGRMVGLFQITIVRWLQGALFDLKGAIFRANGCTFSIPKDQTSRAYRSCFSNDSYEAEERALVCELVRPTDTVLELGACLGIVSCVTNTLLADKTKHVVVEGNPFCIPTLHRNRQRNGAGFLIENCAVSVAPDATFYLHPVYVVGGSTQRKSAFPVKVPSRSLTELAAGYGPFTTLIVDIEGAELEVFAEATKVLEGVRLVIVELHDWAVGESGVDRCREILAAAGLRFRKRAGITEAWERG